jgi:hypothetical protein
MGRKWEVGEQYSRGIFRGQKGGLTGPGVTSMGSQFGQADRGRPEHLAGRNAVFLP